MLSKHSVVVVAGEQISSDLAGEAVILNLKDGVYYGLDDVGARIWNLIQEPQSVDDICDRIFEEYDVGAGQCEHDVLALLDELAAAGLIEVRDATIAPISEAAGA
jgi:hypothetical protein